MFVQKTFFKNGEKFTLRPFFAHSTHSKEMFAGIAQKEKKIKIKNLKVSGNSYIISFDNPDFS